MARLRKSEREPSRCQVCSPGIILCGIFVAILAATSTAQELMLNDPMLNSASGVVNGGTFVGNGWRVDDQFDSIIWHVPSISYGAVEWDIRGLYENETRPGMADKSELFHMYDYTYFDADNTYSPGYRNNPYKHFVRKIGPLGANENGFEVVYKIHDEFFEIDTPVVDWNPATTYTFREEWGPDGAGNSYLRLYRDSELLLNESLPGSYSPTGHSVVLGSSTRRDSQSSSPIGAVFSNLKVWDLADETVLPPLAEPRTGRVDLEDQALQDDGGEFTGLGVSYFQALRRTKYDRARYRNDLDFLARNGVDYIRTLSMVGWYDYWESKEIAPHTFQNENGTTVQGWGDYWQQFRDMIDIAYDEFGIRTQVTIFADAQLIPDEADRINHMDGVLSNIQGREEKVIMLEVANEYWQNGFPDPDGIENVRDFGQYLNNRTEVLVALSSTFGGTNSSLVQMYQGSAADIATEHFTRTNDTVEGGWLPVRAPFRINSVSSVPPVSSNEPIGPGSSVSTENDPIKLVSAAAYAWMSGLPMYVFHSNAGVLGNTQFETMAGITNLRHVQDLLPGDIANWQRTEGKDTISPFTNYANGVANRWWTEVSNPTSGAVRHIANVRGDEFYTLPIGILGGGLQLQARQNMTIQVFNPLDGTVVLEAMPAANEHLTLGQGPEAYLIRGNFADGGPARIDLDVLNNPHGLVHRQSADGDTIAASIGDRNARRNDDPDEDIFFYFDAADWFTYQGDDPLLSITVDYFDQGNGSLTLQYDSNTGNTSAAFYKSGGIIQLTDSDLWKTHTFQVTDAYFGNRQNAGSDFRIGGGVGTPFYLDTVSIVASGPPPTDFQWTASSGSWHKSANWSPALVPNGNDNTAEFTGGGSSVTTVTMNSPATVRAITLDGTGSYRLQGSQTLTLDADVGTAQLTVTGGNHTWTSPVAADTSTTIDIASGAELTLEGLFDFASQTVTKSGSGRLYLDSEATIQRGTFQHNDGHLGGDGMVNGDLIASAGSVAPGHGIGQLSVTGDFTMESGSALEIEIGGTSANQFDALQVTKRVFLDGTLEVTLTDDYYPDFGQQFSIVQALSIANSGIVLGGPDGEKFKLVFSSGQLLLESTAMPIPTDYQWTASSGSWHNSAYWSPAGVPNGNDNTAEFTGGGNPVTTVLIGSPATVRAITLDGSSSYQLQGGQTLTLAADSGTARLNVTGGNHTWTSPVAADTATTIDIASGAELTLEGSFDFAGQTVTKSGSGRLYLDSEVTNQRGTFQHNDGLLGGDGIVNGDLIASAGSVAPGHGIGQLSVTGDFTMESGSALEIEIGGTSANQFDTLQVAKRVFLDGTLEVTLTDDYYPDLGQQFSIVQAVSIANSGIVLGGPDGEKFKLIFSPGLLLLELTAIRLPGDYNNDGTVDAADYTMWRDYNGTTNSLQNDPIGGTIGLAQYQQWKDAFGNSGSGLAAAVPEPSGLALVCIITALRGLARLRPDAILSRRLDQFEGGRP